MLARKCHFSADKFPSFRSFSALLRHNHIPSYKPQMTHICELGQMIHIYKRAGSAKSSFPTKPIFPMKSGLLGLAATYAYNPAYLTLLTNNPGYSALFILFLYMIRKPCEVSYEVQNMFLLQNGVQVVIELRSGHWKLLEIQDISKIVKRESQVEVHLQHEKPLLIRDRKEFKIEEEIYNMVLKGNLVDLKRAGLGYHRFLFRSVLKEMKLKRVEFYELRWNWRNNSQFYKLLRQRKLRCQHTYYDVKESIQRRAGVKKYKTPKEQEEEKRVTAARQEHEATVKQLREKYSLPIYSQDVFYSLFKITPTDLKDTLDGMSESEAERKVNELLQFPTKGRIKALI